MGLYIEVAQNRNKAEQIKAFDPTVVLLKPGEVSWDGCPEGMLPVCVVDNFIFEAAAVAYSKQEFEKFGHPDDKRPRRWLYVPIETIRQLAPRADDYLKPQEA
jgi:hypothetical protein